jgi:hypothetical protein
MKEQKQLTTTATHIANELLEKQKNNENKHHHSTSAQPPWLKHLANKLLTKVKKLPGFSFSQTERITSIRATCMANSKLNKETITQKEQHSCEKRF